MPSLYPSLSSSIAKRQALTLSISAALLRSFSSSAKPSAARVSLYFRRARLIDTLRLRLRSHDPSAPFPLPSSQSLDPFITANALCASPSPDHALVLFQSLRSRPAIARCPVTALAKRLALARRLRDLHQLLADLDAGAFPSSLPPSPMDRLRWLAVAGALPSALHAWTSLRSSSASSGRQGRTHPCTEAYNLVMNIYATTCDHSTTVATFNQMIQEGANPNSRIYAIIKTMAKLEKAYVHDLVYSAEYEAECLKLIAQFKTLSSSLRNAVPSVERFIDAYKMDCPAALNRLLVFGIPATVEHRASSSSSPASSSPIRRSASPFRPS